MKYDIKDIFSTKNNLKVKINQTGSIAMIREKGQDKFTKRQGYRILIGSDEEKYETVGYGAWNESEHDLMCEVIKRERYAHLAYKEAYYDLLQKLASIGFIQKQDEEDEDIF